jgi:Thermostable hemolysin
MLSNSVPGAPPFPKRGASRDAAWPNASETVTHPAERRMVLVPQLHPLRACTEACIQTVYDRVFGTRDLVLPRVLIAWVGGDNRPLCAAGLRTAADGFFSEAYLDAPIERALARRTGHPVARQSIFEITTLASRSADVSTAFVRQLAAFGKDAGFVWSFFTATARLRRLLNDLGIPTFVLAEADPARLADSERWGSYYSHAPRVCAVKGDWLDDLAAPPARSSHA